MFAYLSCKIFLKNRLAIVNREQHTLQVKLASFLIHLEDAKNSRKRPNDLYIYRILRKSMWVVAPDVIYGCGAWWSQGPN